MPTKKAKFLYLIIRNNIPLWACKWRGEAEALADREDDKIVVVQVYDD
jgi:hypothetical protein